MYIKTKIRITADCEKQCKSKESETISLKYGTGFEGTLN